MKRLLGATTLALGLTGASFAAPVSYVIDPTHSMPRFTYNHFGFSTQLSRFTKMAGKVVLDMAEKKGSIDVTIDTASLDTGLDALTKHLRTPDFFDVAKYPTATFKSSFITFEGDRPISVQGDLTLHGVTQSVTFMITSFKHGPHGFLQNREAVGATATAVVSRTAFGLGRFAPSVSDDVTVTVSLEGAKE